MSKSVDGQALGSCVVDAHHEIYVASVYFLRKQTSTCHRPCSDRSILKAES
jgi:hypothetical protein